MKNLILILLCLCVSGCATLSISPKDYIDPVDRAQRDFEDDLKKIEIPPDIAQFYQRNNFTSQWGISKSEWQVINKTLIIKSGDCKDYAVLNKYLLKRINIKSDIYIVKFRDLQLMHAICVFIYKNNFYIFSNITLYRTEASTIITAIKQIYSDTAEVYRVEER